MKLKTSLQLSAIFPIAFAIALAISMAFKKNVTAADTAFVGFMGVLGLTMAAIILTYTKDILSNIKILNKWIDTVLKGDLNPAINLKPSDDEVGQLSKALSRMLRELRSAYSSVQKESLEHKKIASEHKRSMEASQKGSKHLTDALDRMKDVQKEMIRKERLHVLEQVTRGVAHDFSDSLTPILGSTELMLANPDILKKEDEVTMHLETILESVKKARKVVHNLAGFFHGGEQDYMPIDLNTLVKQVVDLTKPSWKEEAGARGITISVNTNLEIVSAVGGDETDFRDILTTLIMNSIDAMPDGGTIAISTRATSPFVTLEVSDTGKGMPEEVYSHCLEPFYSTKGQMGTGMGLTILNGTVRRYHGSLSIKTVVDRGTRVEISLPEWKKPSGPVPTAKQKIKPSGKLNLLVVDDEVWSRRTIERLLAAKGHIVESASSGAECMKHMDGKTFDVILVDRSMPVMTGDELASKIKNISSSTAVIMLTGFGDIMLEEGDLPKDVDIVLPKPATMADIDRALAIATDEEK
ncbi:MAG: response regulator [Kiritimatiellae bacterium]|nr:response regulator [Kiritimatiellia bacterium]